MPQVQIDPSFFKKERTTNYSDWELALFRELFQNAIDQAATRIDISLTVADGAKHVDLVFADNGPGMSRQVLNDVYFSIGASSKDNDPTKIGGMGRARVLTCFAMQSYRILSQDYEVIGKGGDYDVFDHPYTAGCTLRIEVDDSKLSRLQDALNQFIRESQFSAKVFINDERVTAKPVNLGRHIRDLEIHGKPFAKVYVNKSAESQRVIVRVNGVSMFTSSTNARAQVVVEINPEGSRDVLTANRDGLRYYYREALRTFLDELAVDTNAALRSRLRRKTTIVRSASGKKSIVMKPKFKPVVTAAQEAQEAVQNQPSAYYDLPVSSTRVGSYDEDEVVEATSEISPFDVWLNKTFGDIYVFDETENPAIRKVMPTYLPENWKPMKGQGDRVYRKGGNIIRVLLLWLTAVEYALEVGIEVLGVEEGKSLSYAIGFTFPSDDACADHRSEGQDHILSLCPVDDQGKLKYAITNRRDLKAIMAFAQHEVTHVRCSWHGEEFSSVREQIAIRFDEAECFRRMKQALLEAKI